MWKKLTALFGGKPAAVAPPDAEPPPPALGWEAIEATFRRIHGGPEARHWAHTGVRAMYDLQTPPQFPLDGISAWDGGDYWHYVGFGMSELYGKDGDDPAVSGWGYELCLRLRKRAGETEPPIFVCQVLQQLARGQWHAEPYGVGHTIATGRVPESDVYGFVLAEDPDAGTITTPFGRVTFLLLVGVDSATLDAARGGNGPAVLERLRPTGWITAM